MKLSKLEYYPFFAKPCTFVSNNSVLSSEFTYMTEERIQSINFSKSYVIKEPWMWIRHMAMIIYWSEWLSFALTLSLFYLLWYFKTLWLLAHFLPNGKEQILFHSMRRMIKKWYQTIDQYLLCLYANFQ